MKLLLRFCIAAFVSVFLASSLFAQTPSSEPNDNSMYRGASDKSMTDTKKAKKSKKTHMKKKRTTSSKMQKGSGMNSGPAEPSTKNSGNPPTGMGN